MGKSNFEVKQLKSGKYVCKEKEPQLGRKTRKTYLKSDDKKECIKAMRRLILGAARAKRTGGTRKKAVKKKLPKIIENESKKEEIKKEEKSD